MVFVRFRAETVDAMGMRNSKQECLFSQIKKHRDTVTMTILFSHVFIMYQ